MAQGAGGWTMPAEVGPVEFLPVLDVPEPGRQRRLTVFFRWLILIPHFIVLWVLSIAAFFAVVVGWFAALFTAHLPAPIARFLTGFVGYDTRLMASQSLLVDQYPPFALRPPQSYPVRIEVRPGRLNRLAVLFRLILMIPAAIINGLLGTGWIALAFFLWLITLVLGRMPRPVFEATAAVARFRMRFAAYALMLTSAYPKGLFGDQRTAEPPASATRPLVMSGGGIALLIVFLVLGLAADVSNSVWGSDGSSHKDSGTVNTLGR
ncbi:DUF4389 domain-containing protein [Kitasatospora viridis]|uniref:Uncharacterized protein DUF4389 n=1 Tax=Kitasatospora viridis TaxID=281105 RepID=A0A561UPK6_9ACTN|nr:DUF4389 domain-containing protein [Kitasatospora viridis]TWG01280.1 uncharacterized protein DUF4389 [Kitasatospora viridis]